MYVRVGTDIVPVARIARLVGAGEGAFLDRWFTSREIEYCRGMAHPERHFAARLAAKEAVFKALAGDSAGPVPWREVEVVAGADGVPAVRLFGKVAVTATRRGLGTVEVSLSHCEEYAIATAVVLAVDDPDSA